MAMQYFNPGLEETEPRAGFLRGLQNRLGYDPQRIDELRSGGAI